jgi:imidazolonepropionase-like amidohydrolase
MAAIAVLLGASVTVGWGSPQIPGAPQQRPLAIVNVTVHPIESHSVAQATIVLDQGRIVGLGRDVTIPADAERIDGQGQHVYPGLFCTGGQLGLVEINSIRATRDEAEIGANNPNVKAQVAINPDSELIPVTRANGVLLALTMPTGGLISGTSAVMQLDGWTWEDMTLKAPVGMHVNWPNVRRTASRSGRSADDGEPPARDERLQQLEDLFDQAEHYRRKRPESPQDVRLEALVPVIDGSLPLIVSADALSQIESAVAFAVRRKLRLIVYGGYDAPSCAPLLREHGVPVIVPAVYSLPQRRSDPFDAPYTLPERLRAAGVRYCIGASERFGASNLRNLPYHAATAVAYGLPADEALKAITLYPAQILGVADKVGSLGPGKDATLILTDGDPLETTTQVKMAFIQGRRVDLTTRQQQLWQKYREKYRRLGLSRDLNPAD